MSDWQLSSNTVDFRNEERRAANRGPQEMPPKFPRWTCANCGADAANHVYWNTTGGWSCRSCGGSDYPEAAE